MRRREFIKLVASAAAWPFTARAQRTTPVIGFLGNESSGGYRALVNEFHRGLQESGYVEGRDVAIEYRWAEGRVDQLPAMAAELVRSKVSVIVAASTPAALAAKAATTTIPIVFEMAGDPLSLGLVARLDRPGGNVTGVASLSIGMTPKRLQLLYEVVPTARVMALLVNEADPIVAETQSRDARSAAQTLGVNLHVLNASAEREFEAVFASLSQLGIGGLVIAAEPLFRRIALCRRGQN
jgi:putative ABC transport system substrate-binding protein